MSRYRRRRWNRLNEISLERARQHIREAEELSEQLGGTDQDVKRYFFGLPPGELREILEEYGRRYGEDRKAYAESTFEAWRSGRVKMSGLVAGRLYSLLPRRMPLDTKYAMVRTLWEKYRPRSNMTYYVGPDVEPETLHRQVTTHLDSVFERYQVPTPLRKRFEWLSDGDVGAYHQLLDYFLNEERKLALQTAGQKLPVLTRHLRENPTLHQRYREVIEIGSHTVRIEMDAGYTGLSTTPPRRAPSAAVTGRAHGRYADDPAGCLVVLALLAIVTLSTCTG